MKAGATLFVLNNLISNWRWLTVSSLLCGMVLASLYSDQIFEAKIEVIPGKFDGKYLIDANAIALSFKKINCDRLKQINLPKDSEIELDFNQSMNLFVTVSPGGNSIQLLALDSNVQAAKSCINDALVKIQGDYVALASLRIEELFKREKVIDSKIKKLKNLYSKLYDDFGRTELNAQSIRDGYQYSKLVEDLDATIFDLSNQRETIRYSLQEVNTYPPELIYPVRVIARNAGFFTALYFAIGAILGFLSLSAILLIRFLLKRK